MVSRLFNQENLSITGLGCHFRFAKKAVPATGLDCHFRFAKTAVPATGLDCHFRKAEMYSSHQCLHWWQQMPTGHLH